MKTTIPKNIEKKWLLIDASGKIVGRMASRIADLLRGKNKPYYTSHVDTGDYIIVVNADKINVSGKKLEQKRYFSHSGYLGNIKEKKLKDVLGETPEKVIFEAVKGMLPKNRSRKHYLKKLYVYKGEEHKHEAQKPEKIEI